MEVREVWQMGKGALSSPKSLLIRGKRLAAPKYDGYDKRETKPINPEFGTGQRVPDFLL